MKRFFPLRSNSDTGPLLDTLTCGSVVGITVVVVVVVVIVVVVGGKVVCTNNSSRNRT